MLTVRLVQTAPERGDVAMNVERTETTVRQAVSDGVDLLVFPELSLTGYHLSAAEFHDRRTAVEAGLDQVARAATDLTVVVGTPTYEPLRNSAAVLADGDRVSTYHKTHLYGAECDVFEPGSAIDPIETPAGTVGVEICYDLEFPEVARELTLGDADVLVTISANMRPFEPYQSAYLRARAMENGIPHLLCNRVGVEDDTDFFGDSGAVDVHGEPIGSANADEATTVTVTLDPTERQDGSLTYHDDRRPSLYRRGRKETIERIETERTAGE